MKKLSLLVLTALFAFALAACGGGNDGGGDAAGQSIDVLMNDIYFGDTNDNIENPPTWTINTGGTVAANLENAGALEHNFAILTSDAQLPDTVNSLDEVSDWLVYETGEVLGGETETKTFTAPAPGEYLVICTVAGHYPAMQGRLTVNP